MENKRAIIIALICFLISMLLINAYAKVKRHELTSTFGEEVQVVVASADIGEYSVIRPGQLTTKTVFKNFRQPNTAEKIEDIVGKATYVPIYEGEQVTFTKLVHEDGRPVLDRQVEKKMRAVTIPITPNSGVGRLIRPGNRVDIMTSVNYDQDGTTIFEIKTLVQNALVLATGKNLQNAVPTRVSRDVLNYFEEQFEARRRKDLGSASMESLATGRPDDNYTNLTLQLTPEDAERVLFLSHALGDSRIYFTLRNSADQGVEKLDTTILDDVLGPESDYGVSKRKPPPPPPPRPPRFRDSIGGNPVDVY